MKQMPIPLFVNRITAIAFSTFVLVQAPASMAAEKARPGTGMRCEVAPTLLEPGEKAEWKGACADGKPTGTGVLTWREASLKGRQKTRTFEGNMTEGLPSGQGIMQLANGDRYEGFFVAGVLQGPAIYTFANGNRYNGTLADSMPHGNGSLSLRSGETIEANFVRGVPVTPVLFHFGNGKRFEGDFSDSRPHGKGVLYFPNGDRAEGTLVDKEIVGQGKFILASGSRYEGLLTRSRPAGSGTLVLTNGDRIDGSFDADANPQGRIILTSARGDRYEGEVVKGEKGTLFPTGNGRLTLRSGDTLQGNFANGLPNGKVSLTQAKGGGYEGSFLNGRRQGAGTQTWADGSRYQGEFTDGLPHGQGTLSFPDGRQYSGGFDKGLPSGKGRLENGWVLEGSFTAGMPSGEFILTMPNKSLFSGSYTQGLRSGKGTLTRAGEEKVEWEFDQDAPKEDNGPHFSIFKSKNEELAALMDDGFFGWAHRYWQNNRPYFEDRKEESAAVLNRLAQGVSANHVWQARIHFQLASLLLADAVNFGQVSDLEKAEHFLAQGGAQLTQAKAFPIALKVAASNPEEAQFKALSAQVASTYVGLVAHTFALGQIEEALALVELASRKGIPVAQEPALSALNDLLAARPERVHAAQDAIDKLIEKGFPVDRERLLAAYKSQLDQALATDNLQQALDIARAAELLEFELVDAPRANRMATLLGRSTRASYNLDLLLEAMEIEGLQKNGLANQELVDIWAGVVARKVENGDTTAAIQALRRAAKKGVKLSQGVRGPMTQALYARLEAGDASGMLQVYSELAQLGVSLVDEFKKRLVFLRSGNFGGNTPFPFSVKNETGLSLLDIDDFIDNERDALETLGRYDYLVLIDVHPRHIAWQVKKTSKIDSSFSEGFEDVPNPEYQKLEASLSTAQLQLAQASSQTSLSDQSTGNKKVDQVMGVISVLNALSGAAAKPDAATALARVQSLQSQLGQTPRTIRQPIHVNYQYEEVDLELKRAAPVSIFVVNRSKKNYSRQSAGLIIKDAFSTTLGIHPKDKKAKRLERFDRVRHIERKTLTASLPELLTAAPSGSAPAARPTFMGLDNLAQEISENRSQMEQAILRDLETNRQEFDKAINAAVANLHEDARQREEQVVELMHQVPEMPARSSRDGRKLGAVLGKLGQPEGKRANSH